MVLSLKKIRLIRKYKLRGCSKREIAKKVPAARGTVRKYIKIMNIKKKKAKVNQNLITKSTHVSSTAPTHSSTSHVEPNTTTATSSSTRIITPTFLFNRKFVDRYEKVWNYQATIASPDQLNGIRRQLGANPSRKSNDHHHFVCVGKKQGPLLPARINYYLILRATFYTFPASTTTQTH